MKKVLFVDTVHHMLWEELEKEGKNIKENRDSRKKIKDQWKSRTKKKKEIANKNNLYVSPLVDQQSFLLELGKQHRLKRLTKNLSSSKAEKVASEIKRLIDPDKMGTLFKVIAITKNKKHLEGLNQYA